MPKNLILAPTDLERRVLGPMLAGRGTMALCGFGLVAAAARTAGLIAADRPDHVLLVGIAGRLDSSLSVGEAYCFDKVACFGVGAGAGEAFMTAGAMGWSHWPGDQESPSMTIGDVIALSALPHPASAGLLLTTCAASASAHDAEHRRRCFPDARAEDMEGFGVALACTLAGIPLSVVRGISNTAGDRDTSEWRITDALHAAASLARQVLEGTR